MNKQFYKDSLKMLFPIILQNIFIAMMGSVDVIMLNSVGQDAIAAGSLATQYSGLVFMFYSGISSGSILLAAQYFGKKDFKALEAIEGIALKCSLAVAVAFSVGASLFPEKLMRVYTADPVLISEGAEYLRIIWVFYLLWAVSNTYFSMLRSANHVSVATFFNGVGFFLNIILNAVFIFGFFGIEKM